VTEKTPSRAMTQEETASWKRRLVLVSTAPTRFVGLVSEEDLERGVEKTFYLHHALMFMSMIGQKPQGNGVTLIPTIRGLVPFELMEAVSVEIVSPTYVLWPYYQAEKLRDWFYDEYLSFFDPPMVVQPPGSGLKV
jgi:hypothetical protein